MASTLRVARRHGDAGTLVLPGEPVGHIDPRGPAACHVAVCIEPVTDPENAPVLLRRIVHHQDDEIAAAVVEQVGDRDVGALVLPGKPARHIDPWRPARGDVPRGVEVPADAVQATVGLLPRVVDHQQNEVTLGDRDPCPLILAGEPVRHLVEAVRHGFAPIVPGEFETAVPCESDAGRHFDQIGHLEIRFHRRPCRILRQE